MDDPAFQTEESHEDLEAQIILLHASNHDLAALKPYLKKPGAANVKDPTTGYSPLHSAIAACAGSNTANSQPQTIGTNTARTEGEAEQHENGDRGSEAAETEVDMEAAIAVVKELFLSGAIWNDLDENNETPGCIAYRLGKIDLYEACVSAGVRAEMLLNLMGGLGGYEMLADDDSEEDEMVGDAKDTEASESMIEIDPGHEVSVQDSKEETGFEIPNKEDVNSAAYLASSLTFTADKLLDADANGVMMAWETDIMQRTCDLMIPATRLQDSFERGGPRILNIGFGMGIIDGMFTATSPKPFSHHIIEAHPAVLARIEAGETSLGDEWKQSAPEGGKYVIHAGRWQDIVQGLLEDGEVFDAIYFDTFGEDYSELKTFFSEYVVGLLHHEGIFSFFNGLGADRRICYDVYCKVVEMDLWDAGLDVEWTGMEVGELGGENEGEWKGVRRRYWTLDKYQLPICSFMG